MGKYAEICTYSHDSRGQSIKTQTTEYYMHCDIMTDYEEFSLDTSNARTLVYNGNETEGCSRTGRRAFWAHIQQTRAAVSLQGPQTRGTLVKAERRAGTLRGSDPSTRQPAQPAARGSLGGTGCVCTQAWGGGVLAVAPAALFPRAGTSPGISHRRVLFPLSRQQARALSQYKGQASSSQRWARFSIARETGYQHRAHTQIQVPSCCVFSGHEPPAWFRT